MRAPSRAAALLAIVVHLVGALEHADLQHHARDPVDGGLDREFVEAQALAALVDQHVDAGLACRAPERARTLGTFEHDLRAERQRELAAARTS